MDQKLGNNILNILDQLESSDEIESVRDRIQEIMDGKLENDILNILDQLESSDEIESVRERIQEILSPAPKNYLPLRKIINLKQLDVLRTDYLLKSTNI